jgi:hypothetical protein
MCLIVIKGRRPHGLLPRSLDELAVRSERDMAAGVEACRQV